MELSVVTTLYQSEHYIREFHERTTAAISNLGISDYEIVFVNDGSPDRSLEIAVEISKKDPKVVVVDLSRNFGHHRAIMTGLAHSTGELIFLIDSDLEEEPEWMISFKEQMDREKCDVVYGVQKRRKGRFFERISGTIFYALFKLFSKVEVTENMIITRLMSRRYVNALLEYKEKEIYIPGLWSITGFDQRFQIINKHSSSTSTYTFTRKISLFVNSITAFSNTPLLLIFYTGCLILLIALIYSAYLVIDHLFFSIKLTGWTSMIVSIWFLGGLNMAFLGIIGIYLSKVFSETKQRPYSTVRHIYRSGS